MRGGGPRTGLSAESLSSARISALQVGSLVTPRRRGGQGGSPGQERSAAARAGTGFGGLLLPSGGP